jgi:hypothetical protein
MEPKRSRKRQQKKGVPARPIRRGRFWIGTGFFSGIAPLARARVMKVFGAWGKVPNAVRAGREVNAHLIPKNHPAIIGTGTREIVIDLGKFRKGKGVVPLVAKVLTANLKELKGPTTKTHYVAHPGDAIPRATELTSNYMRRNGFPVPAMHALPFGGSPRLSCWCVVTENLQRPGLNLSEAKGFRFERLRNGQSLKESLEKYLQKLRELDSKDLIEVNRHVIGGSPENAFRQCFFVRWNPKTKKGELVMGDLDHVAISSNVRERYLERIDQNIAKRNPK